MRNSEKNSRKLQVVNGNEYNPAREADEIDLRNNIQEIRKLMSELDSFNYKIQRGNPDLGEEIRQGSFVAVNKSIELSEMLRQILLLIEKNHDY